MAELVVVGGINQDVVVQAARRPLGGETVVGDGPLVGCGGKGANTAVAAARAGAQVALCGAVGDDAAGRGQVDALSREGVQVGSVQVRADVATGVALIVLTPDGENSIVVGRGANATLTDQDVRRACAGASVVLGQTEVGAGPVDAAAQTPGARFVLSLAPVLPLDPATLARADPLLLNESEAAEVVRPSSPGADSPDPAAAVVAATGCRSAVVTLGARGAAVALPGTPTVLVPAPQVDPLDTTGAGDALAGTLAAHLAAGADLVDAVVAACAAAAVTVQRLGARG